jgi:REase_DpnII-MboI
MTEDQLSFLKKLAVRVDGLRRAMDAVMGGTTPDHAKWSAFKHYARAYNTFASEYIQVTGEKDVNIYNLDKVKGSLDTLWPVQKEIFDTVYADTLILSGLLCAYDVGISASISEIQDLLVANVRKIIFSKPDKEIDVQNAIESLLVGRGYQKPLDYDRETGRVKFSGKEFVPDFIFKSYSLALEVKLIKIKSDVSKCVEQMSADIPAYRSTYNNLLFCVYDLGEIRDVNEFQDGLEKQGGVRVCVIKH